MTCIYCREALTPVTREAHYIPSAIGGRLSSRTVCCDLCNNGFRPIEGAFCDALADLTALVGVVRGERWQAPHSKGPALSSPPSQRIKRSRSAVVSFSSSGVGRGWTMPWAQETTPRGKLRVCRCAFCRSLGWPGLRVPVHCRPSGLHCGMVPIHHCLEEGHLRLLQRRMRRPGWKDR